VVAGNVSSTPKRTKEFLYQLSDHYEHVVFVDGPLEHSQAYEKIDRTVIYFERYLNKRDNITYLDDSTAIIDNCAYIGANGWWGYDYDDSAIHKVNSMYEVCTSEKLSLDNAVSILHYAQEQTVFLAELIGNLSDSEEVEKIVVVTSATPHRALTSGYTSLYERTKRLNNHLHQTAQADPNGKVNMWAHGGAFSNDTYINGLRYVSHPHSMFPTYYPKLVT
jgi:hypothetical protein